MDRYGNKNRYSDKIYEGNHAHTKELTEAYEKWRDEDKYEDIDDIYRYFNDDMLNDWESFDDDEKNDVLSYINLEIGFYR